MLTCQEVVSHADALVDGELSWCQRQSLRLHLLMCQYCRRYVHNIRLLVKAVPFMHRRASEKEVEKVMRRIKEDDQ